MTNALNDLRLKWRAREREMIAANASEAELETLRLCILELVNTVEDVRPIPLNEASTEKLYRWSSRMITIFDHMIDASQWHPGNDPAPLAHIADQLGHLADRPFLNDMYDLFKHLANRRAGA